MISKDQLKQSIDKVTTTFTKENTTLKNTVAKLEDENEDLKERLIK